MMISVNALTLLVMIALAITVLAPVVLIILWVKDRLKEQLW